MNIKKIIVHLFFLFFTVNAVQSQTINCTRELSTLQPADVNNQNWVIPATGITCVSSNISVARLEIQSGGTLIIKPGVVLTITNSIQPGNVPSRTSTVDVYGELKFSQSVTVPMSTNLTVYSAGKVTAGSNGTANLTFGGNVSKIINNGIFSVGTIDFNNNSSVNTIDNQGILTVAGNMNMQQSNTSFRNGGTLTISSSFNSNSNSVYVNCGTFSTQGFNLQGGKIYNSGTFTANGSINFGASTAFFENYGTFSGTGIQLGGGASYVYNSGNFTLSGTFQNNGNLQGPTSGTNYGKFTINGRSSINSGSVTGRLNLINSTNANSNASTMFNNGITIASSVVFGTCSSCSVVTTGIACLNPDGTTPTVVDAVADSYTVTGSQAMAGVATIGNVLANDTFNSSTGGTATVSNVAISIVNAAASINNGPIPSVNVATGVVTVPSGIPAGVYTINYRICALSSTSTCDTDTVTITVETPAIDAVADNFTSSGTGSTTTTLLANDTYKGGAAGSATTAVVDINKVGIWPTAFTLNTNGTITVASGTAAGIYELEYKICDKINPLNCENAIATITISACYLPGSFDPNAGISLDTSVGISSLDRAGAVSAWPQARKSGWIALEAKTKGFVVNRVKFANNVPVAQDGVTRVITKPIEGMMVYDTTNDCLKVYTTTNGINFAWFCMTTQTCPE